LHFTKVKILGKNKIIFMILDFLYI